MSESEQWRISSVLIKNGERKTNQREGENKA